MARNRVRFTCNIAAGVCFAFRMANAGTVITDGSLGRATTLSDPSFSITANLGQTHGDNLCQFFKQFALSPGDIANFSGPTSIKNVITRGAASNIDCTLRCTIANADFTESSRLAI